MSGFVPVNLINDDQRSVRTFRCDHKAVSVLRGSSDYSGASCDAIFRVDDFDPLDIIRFKGSNRYKTNRPLLAAQHHQQRLFSQIPDVDDFLALTNAR